MVFEENFYCFPQIQELVVGLGLQREPLQDEVMPREPGGWRRGLLEW